MSPLAGEANRLETSGMSEFMVVLLTASPLAGEANRLETVYLMDSFVAIYNGRPHSLGKLIDWKPFLTTHQLSKNTNVPTRWGS